MNAHETRTAIAEIAISLFYLHTVLCKVHWQLQWFGEMIYLSLHLERRHPAFVIALSRGAEWRHLEARFIPHDVHHIILRVVVSSSEQWCQRLGCCRQWRQNNLTASTKHSNRLFHGIVDIRQTCRLPDRKCVVCWVVLVARITECCT